MDGHVLIPGCCREECFSRKFNFADIPFGAMIRRARFDLDQMEDKYERDCRLRNMLRDNIIRVTEKGYLIIDYKINGISVCKIAWLYCYGVTESLQERLVREIKDGIVGNTRDLNDRSAPDHSVLSSIVEIAKTMNITISSATWSSMFVPNGTASKMTHTWMSGWFTACGDHIPNALEGEIHLEPTQVRLMF